MRKAVRPLPHPRSRPRHAALAVLSLSLGATPGFWEAATQADFLRGEVEHLSIDEHGRLMLGPEVRSVHDAGAPFVWTMVAGPDESIVPRHRQRRQGPARRSQRQRHRCSSTAARWKSTPSRRRPDGGLYVGTSPDGRIYKRRREAARPRRSSIPTTSTSGRSPSMPRASSTPGTGEKGIGLSHHAGRQGHAVLHDQDDACDDARLRSERTAAGRHRRAGPRLPRRRAGQGLPAARYDLPGSARRCASIRRACSTSRRRAAGRARAATPRRSR